MKKADKEEERSPLRVPGQKKRSLGLQVPTIRSPHLELVSSLETREFPAEYSRDAQVDNIGRPVIPVIDAHVPQTWAPYSEIHGRPGITTTDAQDVNTGRPTEEELDAQHDKHRTPDKADTGRLERNNLDAMTPNAGEWAPMHGRGVGAKTPEPEILGAQDLKHRAAWEKNRSTERLALRPNGKILIQIKVFCAQHNYTLTEFFELAGLHFMELGAQAETKAGAMAPLNDLRLKIGSYKTQRPIIDLYSAYTRRFNEFAGGKWAGKWLPRDDQIGMLYNETDIRLIELGIMQTQSNKGVGNGKIQTFQYYVNEINATIETNTLKDSGLDMIVQHHREILERWFGKPLDLDDNAAEGKSA